MPLHPQVEGLLGAMAAQGAKPIWSLSLADARSMPANLVPLGGQPPEPASVHDRSIDLDGRAIGLRVYTPHGEGPFPVTMFFHGGGFVICDLDSHDPICRDLCADTGSIVVSVDYRLAPEHRFPAAPEDCYGALCWVAENGNELGADTSRIAVCGDSAGGNLSAVVSQMARDRGGPALRYAALMYPATDMTDASPSIDENASGYFLEKADMAWFYAHYLDETQATDPMASPALAPNLGGLPPTFVAVCEFDPLRDQGIAYAEKLNAAGTPAELKLYPGMIHAIANMAGVIDGGRELLDDVGSRLRSAFA